MLSISAFQALPPKQRGQEGRWKGPVPLWSSLHFLLLPFFPRDVFMQLFPCH